MHFETISDLEPIFENIKGQVFYHPQTRSYYMDMGDHTCMKLCEYDPPSLVYEPDTQSITMATTQNDFVVEAPDPKPTFSDNRHIDTTALHDFFDADMHLTEGLRSTIIKSHKNVDFILALLGVAFGMLWEVTTDEDMRENCSKELHEIHTEVTDPFRTVGKFDLRMGFVNNKLKIYRKYKEIIGV